MRLFGAFFLQKRWCETIIKRQLKVVVVQRDHRGFDGLDNELANAMLHSDGFLSQFNVMTADLAQVSTKQQLALVNSAEIVVAHHGAGMIGSLFVNEGTVVIQILPSHMCSWSQMEFSLLPMYSGALPLTHCVPDRLVHVAGEGEEKRREAAAHEFEDSMLGTDFQPYLYFVQSVQLTALQLRTMLQQARLAMISRCLAPLANISNSG